MIVQPSLSHSSDSGVGCALYREIESSGWNTSAMTVEIISHVNKKGENTTLRNSHCEHEQSNSVHNVAELKEKGDRLSNFLPLPLNFPTGNGKLDHSRAGGTADALLSRD